MSRFAMVILVLVLAGCSSLVVRQVPDGAASGADGGVRYALPKPVWVLAVKGTRGGTPVDTGKRDYEISVKPVFVPDPKQVYEVSLSPGLFTSDSLKVTIGEDGTLRNVVSGSEPQLTETLKVVASLAASAAIIAIASKAEEKEPDEKIRDKQEISRLTTLEGDLRTALEQASRELARKPTQDGAETIRLVKDQLAQVSAAKAQLEAKVATDAYTTGTTVSEVIHLEPIRCDGSQAFPEPRDVEALYKSLPDEPKKDPRNRFFVFVRPAGSNGTKPGCLVTRQGGLR